MKPSININTSKNGIEITFPQKPSDNQRALLKANGYRFHNSNKYWWAVIDTNVLNAATEIVGAPVHTTCNASVNLIQRFISSLGKEVKPDVPQALKKDVVGVLNAGTTNLKKELEAINGLLDKMIKLAKKHKIIVPNMGDKALLAQLTHLTKPLKVDTKNGQFALFGIEKRISPPVAEEALYGIDFTDEPFDEGLNGSGLTPYDVITNMLLEKIEKGNLSWRKSWSIGSGGVGRLPASNFVTKKAYTGINALILNFLVEAEHPYWFTFNQIKALGGKLRKGAKYAPVCYYNRIFKLIATNETITEEQAEKLPREQYLILPFLRYYKAYNASDIEGIDTSYDVPVIKAVEAIKSAELIVNGMPNRPPINHGGDSAHYQPSTDKVQMPHMADFDKEQEYYGTLFHELVHSTAHKSRIGRPLTGRFGSKDYAFEELIAVLGASFLCGEAGILYHTMDNSAAYIKGWAKQLTTIISKDNKFIFKATAQAQKAADFIQALHIQKPKTKDRNPVKKPKTIAEKVKANEAELKKLTNHNDLRKWAIDQKMDNRSAFPKFKKALLEIGVDYEKLRGGERKAQADEIQKSVTHEVTFYSDAKASAGRYGITDEDGEPLWHGRFFGDEGNEQSDAELDAAKKAIWLANKVKETIGADAIRLNLYIDAQWLTYQDHPKQKGFALKRLADKYRIDLNTEWIPGKQNPADKWTVATGYKKWSDNNLRDLATPLKQRQLVGFPTKGLSGINYEPKLNPQEIEEPILYVPEYQNRRPVARVQMPTNYPSTTASSFSDPEEDYYEEESGLSGLPSMADAGHSGPVETFNFKGEFGRFLGPIAIEPDSSVVVAITAEKGTGKSHALFQAMEEIASSGYPILFGSYEEFVNSSLFINKRDKYISPENQQMIMAVDQRTLPNATSFFEAAKNYPVVILDSAQELEGGVDINKLRGGTAGQLYIIIYHATTEGKLKGGSGPQHKADVVIVGEKDNDFRNNYFHYGKDGKNRYQVEQGLMYSPYHKKLINESE
ncbi:ArdC family protein [Roseivirga seohaensis]|uniref:ArdC family protein n=1 Tax=Roseivirga seohaensis TaxID=1914963 RepID=UPI003BAD0F54